MVQCADSITGSLSEMKDLTSGEALTAQPGVQMQLEDLIGTSVDAVETIQACATHQKRIVDDILTLSKLDGHQPHSAAALGAPAGCIQDVQR